MQVVFLPEARTRVSKQTLFDEAEHLYAKAAALRTPRVNPQIVSRIAKVPGKVVALLQSGPRRVLELTEGVVREVNAGSFTPMFVLARASVERVCLLHDISGRAKHVIPAIAEDYWPWTPGVDRVHFPAARVSLEAVIPLLVEEFGVPCNTSDDVWRPVLAASEQAFLEIARTARYPVPDADNRQRVSPPRVRRVLRSLLGNPSSQKGMGGISGEGPSPVCTGSDRSDYT